MKVLSLFDGISCGMLALERACIPVERYVAYEIDEPAIKISEKNYPEIERRGDVTVADFTEFKGFDLLLGGSPCQDLSINQKNRKGLKGERSGLFWEYVRALREAEPRYFLFENNYNMPKKDEAIITETLGVKPIMINSALFSAQQRRRLYWTNIPNIILPVDREIIVADIVENNVNRENLFDETVFNGKENIYNRYFNKPLRIGTIGKGGQGERVYSVWGKTVTLTANGGGRGAKTGLYLIGNKVRKLTPVEAERSQCLPDNYTLVDGISENQRYRCIGNGWTVDVIICILIQLSIHIHLNKETE